MYDYRDIKDEAIKRISLNEGIPIKVIEAVVNHQFREAYEATKKCDSLEFYTLFKLFFNKRKANKVYSILKHKKDLGLLSNEKKLLLLDSLEKRLYGDKKNN